MVATKLPGMAKKSRKEAAEATALIRVRKGLQEMLGDIAHHTKTDIADIVDPILRPFVTRRIAEVLAQRAKQIPKPPKEEQ
jgi:hypothetical protein